MSIASTSCFLTTDLLPCPATNAEEGLAAGGVLSSGWEALPGLFFNPEIYDSLCKLVQQQVPHEIWSSICPSSATSRKLCGSVLDYGAVLLAGCLALVLFILARRVEKQDVVELSGNTRCRGRQHRATHGAVGSIVGAADLVPGVCAGC